VSIRLAPKCQPRCSETCSTLFFHSDQHLKCLSARLLKAVYQVPFLPRGGAIYAPGCMTSTAFPRDLQRQKQMNRRTQKKSVGARCASAPLGKSPDQRRRRDYMYFALSRNRVSGFFCGRGFSQPHKALAAVFYSPSGSATVCESVFRSRANWVFLQSDSNGDLWKWENHDI